MSAEAQARYRARHPDRVKAAKARLRKGSRPATYKHSAAYMADQERQAALPSWLKEAIGNLTIARRRVVARSTMARWRAKNGDTIAKHNFFHNSRNRGVVVDGSSLTWDQWQGSIASFNGACGYCLRTDRPLTVDHMDPLSRGGAHDRDNIVPACKPCNSRKRDRSILTMLGSP